MRILVADDSLFMRKTLIHLLTDWGHEVVGEATDGEEAIKDYERLRPDLVTLDITMPYVDGIEALIKIKALDEDALVLMVSALGAKNRVKEALDLGASSFVIKPFSKRELKSVIAAFESRVVEANHRSK